MLRRVTEGLKYWALRREAYCGIGNATAGAYGGEVHTVETQIQRPHNAGMRALIVGHLD